jgi:hypothetical protein
MKTISSPGDQVDQTFYGARVTSASLADRAGGSPSGCQRIVGIVCLTALLLVISCICHTNPVITRWWAQVSSQGNATSSIRAGVSGYDNSLSSVAVPDKGTSLAISSFSRVHDHPIWSMVCLGFLLLLAQRRVLRPATE